MNNTPSLPSAQERFEVEFLNRNGTPQKTEIVAGSEYEARKAVANLKDCDAIMSCRNLGQEQEVRFQKYVSDGPGYTGSVSFRFSKETLFFLAENNNSTPVGCGFPNLMPQVVHVRDGAFTDLQSVWNSLDEDGKDYLEKPEFIDLDRLKILTFKSGETGYILLHGEPQYVSLVKGTQHIFFNFGMSPPEASVETVKAFTVSAIASKG